MNYKLDQGASSSSESEPDSASESGPAAEGEDAGTTGDTTGKDPGKMRVLAPLTGVMVLHSGSSLQSRGYDHLPAMQLHCHSMACRLSVVLLCTAAGAEPLLVCAAEHPVSARPQQAHRHCSVISLTSPVSQALLRTRLRQWGRRGQGQDQLPLLGVGGHHQSLVGSHLGTGQPHASAGGTPA